MSDPRNEQELTTEIEVRTPSWLPGGKLAITYRRLWDKRASDLIDQTAEAANTTVDALLRRIADGDSFADVFQKASRRIVEDGDPIIHDVLRRLVVAALHDDARIDEISFILTKLDHLQPIHIRIIVALPNPASLPSHSRSPKNTTLSTREIAKQVKANVGIVMSALGDLQKDCFVVRVPSVFDDGLEPNYELVELGQLLRRLIDKADRSITRKHGGV
jgi:hypothetical protein